MDWKADNAVMRTKLRNLNQALLETTKDFSAMTKTVHETGGLDAKTKEFAALAISVADRCEPCIGFHVEALIKAGASRDEVADVLSVCIQMGGGPSLMYAAKALDAFDRLSTAAYSGVIRPPVPITSAHPFRFDPPGDSGPSAHPLLACFVLQ